MSGLFAVDCLRLVIVCRLFLSPLPDTLSPIPDPLLHFPFPSSFERSVAASTAWMRADLRPPLSRA